MFSQTLFTFGIQINNKWSTQTQYSVYQQNTKKHRRQLWPAHNEKTLHPYTTSASSRLLTRVQTLRKNHTTSTQNEKKSCNCVQYVHYFIKSLLTIHPCFTEEFLTGVVFLHQTSNNICDTCHTKLTMHVQSFAGHQLNQLVIINNLFTATHNPYKNGIAIHVTLRYFIRQQ